MKQEQINSIFASIDAQRAAIKERTVTYEFYPVIKAIMIEEHHYPDGKLGVHPVVCLENVKDNSIHQINAAYVLKPIGKESIDAYFNRLQKHLDYLDNHALFVEVEMTIIGN